MAFAQVGTRTVEGLLALIARERQGDSVDRTRLKSLLRMFNNLVSSCMCACPIAW